VYAVATRLAFEGFHVSVTFGNAPAVDLLVSSADGGATVAIQVKATAHAGRTRGRGTQKVLHHYEWDVGFRAATTPHPKLLFAFVDLHHLGKFPDIYLVPSKVVVDWFRPIGTLKRYRFHPRVEEISSFCNNWQPLRAMLGSHGL
jgi:hypothetical protein